MVSRGCRRSGVAELIMGKVTGIAVSVARQPGSRDAVMPGQSSCRRAAYRENKRRSLRVPGSSGQPGGGAERPLS
jgi:hypothetical protein